VVIPVEEYRTLRGRAYPPANDPQAPSIDASLTRVDYDLRVDGAVATGKASLTLDVMQGGWVRVPIPAGLLVRDARLGSERISLVPTGKKAGEQAVVISRRGRSVVVLDVAFPVVPVGGEQRLTLPAGSSGITRVSITPDVPDLDLRITGAFQPDKPGKMWVAYARGNEPVTFTWRKKVIEQPREELPLRMRGTLTQIVGLGEDSTSLNADVNVVVSQGAARQVRIAAPESVAISQVAGANVGDWEVKGGVLMVNFLQPTSSIGRFTISGETKLAREGAIDIPLLRLLDTERDEGGVAVEALGAAEIRSAKVEGLEAADAAQLGASVAARQSPSMLAYRLVPGTASRSLSVQVARYTQEAVLTALVEEARFRVLMTTEGKALVQARYAVRNNQRSFVKVTLPAGASVWSESLAGRMVRPGSGPDNALLFPLAKGRPGEDATLFAIEIVYLTRSGAWGTRGRSTVVLPTLDLPVSRSGAVVYSPPGFRITPAPGSFRTANYENAASGVLNGALTPPPTPDPLQATGPGTPARDLVNTYHERWAGRPAAALLPVRVAFPAVGPSAFLVSELTSEGKGPVIDLDYQKDSKGGVK
jgi:hypothetical protein